VIELDGVSVELEVGFPVSVLLADTLGVSLAVRDALSPRDMELVIDGVALPERLSDEDAGRDMEDVPDGVSELDVEAVGVRVDDGVPLPLIVAVALEENDTLGVIEGLAPDDNEDVGDTERDALSDFVDDGDTEDVGDGVVVDAGEVVADGVDALEDEGSPLVEAQTDGLGVSLGVREGLAPIESGGVAEAELLAVRVADDELLTVLLPVRLGVSEVVELEDGV
jgi:hypothetical protein